MAFNFDVSRGARTTTRRESHSGKRIQALARRSPLGLDARVFGRPEISKPFWAYPFVATMRPRTSAVRNVVKSPGFPFFSGWGIPSVRYTSAAADSRPPCPRITPPLGRKRCRGGRRAAVYTHSPRICFRPPYMRANRWGALHIGVGDEGFVKVSTPYGAYSTICGSF